MQRAESNTWGPHVSWSTFFHRIRFCLIETSSAEFTNSIFCLHCSLFSCARFHKRLGLRLVRSSVTEDVLSAWFYFYALVAIKSSTRLPDNFRIHSFPPLVFVFLFFITHNCCLQIVNLLQLAIGPSRADTVDRWTFCQSWRLNVCSGCNRSSSSPHSLCGRGAVQWFPQTQPLAWGKGFGCQETTGAIWSRLR